MKDIETLNYLEELRVLGSNYGLQRTERLLELMGNPHKKLKLIHIAGTNGKGSTSAILGNILIKHGYKVGAFNSPHLEEIEEIIRINNENIKEDDFVNLIREIKPFVNKVVEEGFNHPTEFEVLTCVMFRYLYNQKVDFGIIEVGLGGFHINTVYEFVAAFSTQKPICLLVSFFYYIVTRQWLGVSLFQICEELF